MKAVLISIKPKWCELIASGEKTAEVRKSRPKLETPFKCYIYCTLAGSNEFFHETLNGDVARWNREKWGLKKGKVIGEFVCNEILTAFQCNSGWIWENARIPPGLFFDYLGIPRETHFGYEKKAYAWRISDLVIYDKPKELSELIPNCQYGQDGECTGASEFYCPFQKRDYNPDGSINLVECGKKITRPPQSWCYVEELKGENHGN